MAIKTIDLLDATLLQQALNSPKEDAAAADRQPLQGLAALDALTRIYNREFFESHLDAQWKIAQSGKTSLAFFLIDVDGFGKFSEAYDQQTADYALLKIAKALKLFFRRSTDFVCRYAGDQFAVLATRLEETHTTEYAATVCDRVSKLKIYNATSNLGYLTISIGFVICQPQDGETQQVLIDQAKQRLQRAKDQGRNRSVGDEANA
jgi:diguanylate cyclase (GGDEF)-like protein